MIRKNIQTILIIILQLFIKIFKPNILTFSFKKLNIYTRVSQRYNAKLLAVHNTLHVFTKEFI